LPNIWGADIRISNQLNQHMIYYITSYTTVSGGTAVVNHLLGIENFLYLFRFSDRSDFIYDRFNHAQSFRLYVPPGKYCFALNLRVLRVNLTDLTFCRFTSKRWFPTILDAFDQCSWHLYGHWKCSSSLAQ
jgi:hypothetical protein